MTNPLRIAVLAASTLLPAIPRAADAQKLTGTIIMRVTADSIPIRGAAVATGTANAVTDQSGWATFTLPTGQHTFRVTPDGFRPESLAVFVDVGTTKVTFPVHHKLPAPQMPVVAQGEVRRDEHRETRRASDS